MPFKFRGLFFIPIHELKKLSIISDASIFLRENINVKNKEI